MFRTEHQPCLSWRLHPASQRLGEWEWNGNWKHLPPAAAFERSLCNNNAHQHCAHSVAGFQDHGSPRSSCAPYSQDSLATARAPSSSDGFCGIPVLKNSSLLFFVVSWSINGTSPAVNNQCKGLSISSKYVKLFMRTIYKPQISSNAGKVLYCRL